MIIHLNKLYIIRSSISRDIKASIKHQIKNQNEINPMTSFHGFSLDELVKIIILPNNDLCSFSPIIIPFIFLIIVFKVLTEQF